VTYYTYNIQSYALHKTSHHTTARTIHFNKYRHLTVFLFRYKNQLCRTRNCTYIRYLPAISDTGDNFPVTCCLCQIKCTGQWEFLLNRETDERRVVTFQYKIPTRNGGTHECKTTTMTSYTLKILKKNWLSWGVIKGSKEIAVLKLSHNFTFGNIIYSVV
jgi:DNA gyrase/topoisomerase IV subunit B